MKIQVYQCNFINNKLSYFEENQSGGAIYLQTQTDFILEESNFYVI